MGTHKSFYFYETEYLRGNTVFVKTYDGIEYTGKIKDIFEYDDHYHSSPVMALTIKTGKKYVELDDYEIKEMKYIK